MSIEVKNISFAYHKGTNIICDASFSLRNGDSIGLMGATGSGKSTLLALMGGFLRPLSGQILVDGENVSLVSRRRLAYIRTQLGIVVQFPEDQIFERSVFEEVAFGPRQQRLSPHDVNARVTWALDIVGLPWKEMGGVSPLTLSAYDQRRVALAGVLANKPLYLLLDEPTAGLDFEQRKAFHATLKRCQQEQGMSIFLASHSWEDIINLCDRLMVLDQGKLIINGRVGDVISDIPGKWGSDNLPDLSFLLYRLKEHGWPVDFAAITVEEAAEMIQHCVMD